MNYDNYDYSLLTIYICTSQIVIVCHSYHNSDAQMVPPHLNRRLGFINPGLTLIRIYIYNEGKIMSSTTHVGMVNIDAPPMYGDLGWFIIALQTIYICVY